MISPVDANNNHSHDCTDPTSGGLFEQRVKVDRKKFEQIINGDNKEMGSAEEFFKRIITETNTEITWPTKLKSGTKSKKDPHIRIVGSPDAIAKAKERILDYLDSRKNRVTLKMDVSFTDHSHIIGKGGRSIQKVMDETGCHIHFPDSNRTNLVEKSNQVSIAGTALGAEQARCRIRELLPLTVYFELPLAGLKASLFDTSSTPIQTIQQNYGISVNIRLTGKVATSAFTSATGAASSSAGYASIAIRGARAQCFAMKQGITVLIDYLSSSTISAASIPITLVIDIASQHHTFVAGRGNINIRSIMQQTGVVITFPDSTANGLDSGSNSSATSAATPYHVPLSARKSTVIIKGPSFDSVLFAWQELLGYLPLVLIFDLKEGQELDSSLTTQLMEDLKVSILVKPKQKQNLNSIMVRGPERDSRNLFEVRKQILGLDDSEVPVCCDKHAWLVASKLFSMFLPYCMPSAASAFASAASGPKPSPLAAISASTAASVVTDSAGSLNSTPTSPAAVFNWPTAAAAAASVAAADYNNLTNYPNFSGLPTANGFLQAMFAQQLATLAAQHQAQQAQQQQIQQSNIHFGQDMRSHIHGSKQNTSYSSLNTSGNSMDLKPLERQLSFTAGMASNSSNVNSGFTNTTNSPSINSPVSTISSDASSIHSPLDLSPTSRRPLSSVFSHLAVEEHMSNQQQQRSSVPTTPSGWPANLGPIASTTNGNQNGSSVRGSDHLDYEERKLLAVKALRDKSKVSEVRTPTPIWAGFGLSKSFPPDVLRSRLDSSRVLEKLPSVVESPDELVMINAAAAAAVSESSTINGIWDSGRSIGNGSNSASSLHGLGVDSCIGPSKSGSKGTLRKQHSFDLSSTISSSLSSCSSASSTSSLFSTNNFFDTLSNTGTSTGTGLSSSSASVNNISSNNCNSNGNICESNNNCGLYGSGGTSCNVGGCGGSNTNIKGGSCGASCMVNGSANGGYRYGNLGLVEVLSHLGFSKYIDNFQQHDVDFNTFLTLNDADLQELGISYFGRRKLSSAIFELKRALKHEHQQNASNGNMQSTGSGSSSGSSSSRGSLSPLSHFEVAPGAERSRRAKMSS